MVDLQVLKNGVELYDILQTSGRVRACQCNHVAVSCYTCHGTVPLCPTIESNRHPKQLPVEAGRAHSALVIPLRRRLLKIVKGYVYTWYLVHRFSACTYSEIAASRVRARSLSRSPAPFPTWCCTVYDGDYSCCAFRPFCGRYGAASSGFTATCGSFWQKRRLRSSISACL